MRSRWATVCWLWLPTPTGSFVHWDSWQFDDANNYGLKLTLYRTALLVNWLWANLGLRGRRPLLHHWSMGPASKAVGSRTSSGPHQRNETIPPEFSGSKECPVSANGMGNTGDWLGSGTRACLWDVVTGWAKPCVGRAAAYTARLACST